MKKLYSTGLVGLTSVLLLTGLSDNSSTFFLLPVPVHTQKQSNWCWAATTQMILQYLGADPAKVSQCLLASTAAVTNCCQDSLPDGCNIPLNPDFNVVLNGVRFSSSPPINMNQNGLTWTAIKNQIHDKKKPFVYARQYEGGSIVGRHIVAVVGYAKSGGENYVLINDPLGAPADAEPDRGTNNAFLTLDEYRVGEEGLFRHWYDIIDITRNGP